MNYSIKKLLLTLTLPAALLVTYSCQPKSNHEDSTEVAEDKNDEKFDDKADEKDAQFVVDAVAANYAEIGLAELAEQKSSNTEVKEIATMLKSDHTELLNKLKTYASMKNISVPTEAPDDAKDHINKLRDEDASDFDKKWCGDLKDAHDKVIKMFEKEVSNGSDMELKDLASAALPTIKAHDEKLEACHDKLK
jgi:putative membrane protein